MIRPAFTLIDAAVALLLALTGLLGLASMQRGTARALADADRLHVARRLLHHTRTWAPERLAPGTRGYDVLGLPDEDRPFYRMEITRDVAHPLVHTHVRVAWPTPAGTAALTDDHLAFQP